MPAELPAVVPGVETELARIWHALKKTVCDLLKSLLPRLDSNQEPFG
jgi:hypothetical protein